MDPRQQPAPAHRQPAPAPAPASALPLPDNNGGLLSKLVAIAVLLAALSLLGYFLTRAINTVAADGAVKGKQYQAVFLTNGQVYFGKVSKVDGSYVKLNDIYYLQVSNSNSTQTVQPKDSSAANNQSVSLAKLGGELHGPEDAMYINRDQVLFWENLKNDGKVADAISKYKKDGTK